MTEPVFKEGERGWIPLHRCVGGVAFDGKRAGKDGLFASKLSSLKEEALWSAELGGFQKSATL